jgi:mannose-1-phosphate guanylyltransferase
VGVALAHGDAAGAEAAAARVYPGFPSISIDHGVMEKATDVVAVPGSFGWSDVGSWAAVAELVAHDAAGNARRGDAVVVDGGDNLTFTDAGVIALVGVSGLAVVRAGDAVLVLPADRAQDVRAAVEALTRAGLSRYL